VLGRSEFGILTCLSLGILTKKKISRQTTNDPHADLAVEIVLAMYQPECEGFVFICPILVGS
jgi:hypothetical protein